MRAHKITIYLLPLAALLLSHCGVKGDPIAPDVPPAIGSGKPTVKRVFKKQKSQDVDENEDDSDE